MNNWLDNIDNMPLGRLTSMGRSIALQALPVFSLALLLSFAVLNSLSFMGYWYFLCMIIAIYSFLVTIGQFLVSSRFHKPLSAKARFKPFAALFNNLFPVAISVGVAHMVIAGERTSINLLLTSSGLLFFSMYFLMMPAFHIISFFGKWYLGQNKETIAEVKQELKNQPLFPRSYMKNFLVIAIGTSTLLVIYLLMLSNMTGIYLWLGVVWIMFLMGLGFLRSISDWYVISALAYNLDGEHEQH